MLRPLPRHPDLEELVELVELDAHELRERDAEVERFDDLADLTPELGPRESREPREFGGLADVLEPLSPSPVSVRAPVQVQDFAFADTVVARELASDEPAPPSGPIFVNDVAGSTQCMTPLAFPIQPAAGDASLGTQARVLAAQLRHAVRYAIEEMRDLWAGTAEIVDSEPAAAHARFVRRIVALWSCWQWDRTDLTRAAMIGLAVFVTAATLGASLVGASAGAAGVLEVRAAHTLDQHTANDAVVRAKGVVSR